MKMNFLFPVSILFLLVFASCSKSDSGGGPGTTPSVAQTMMNVAYGTDPQQKMDIYLPANRSTSATKVIILIHGGGWISGDKADFTSADIDTLKNRIPGYAIFNINYRLAALPATNTFPTQEMDVKKAVEFIFGKRTEYVVSDKFVLMGGSAGAHLALLHAYKYPAPVKIKAVIDFFGPTDMVAMYNDYAINPPAQLGIVALMNGTTPANNLTFYQQSSPLSYVSATSSPTIILQGGLDAVVNATTQSRALETQLNSKGVVNQYVDYPFHPHGPWDAVTNTDAFNKIQAFLAANVP